MPTAKDQPQGVLAAALSYAIWGVLARRLLS